MKTLTTADGASITLDDEKITEFRSSFRGDLIIGQWANANESASHIAWVKSFWDTLEPHLPGRAYVNHLSSDDRPEKVRGSFGQNYDRLRLVKRLYDPTNLFRLNANIAA